MVVVVNLVGKFKNGRRVYVDLGSPGVATVDIYHSSWMPTAFKPSSYIWDLCNLCVCLFPKSQSSLSQDPLHQVYN